MLDPKFKEKVALAYVAVGDIGYSIALNNRKGKDHSSKQKELKDRARKVRLYLKILLRHVNLETTPPTLYRISEIQANRLLKCIIKVTKTDTYPIVPALILPIIKPRVIIGGKDGADGINGLNGDDSNIIVEPEVGEEQIMVTSQVVDGVRHDRIKFTPYKQPTIGLNIDGLKVLETGVIITSHNISITTQKGSKNITELTITNNPTLNDALRAVLNLATINGATQPVVTVLSNTNIQVDTEYIVEVTDGTVFNISSDKVNFYFPFLFGATDITNPVHYSALTKLIEAHGNKSFNLNGVDKYFWIGYPSSYPALTRIKDQNGFVVTDSFTIVLANVTSTGLSVNWTEEYRFYRTTFKTDINNQPYTIES